MLIFENLPDPIRYFESMDHRFQSNGSWRTTNCFFHGGSDSLRVHAASGAWKCMNCGLCGGDIISYHMKSRDLDFKSACEDLGAWDGRTVSRPKERPKPFSSNRAIEIISFEILLISIELSRLRAGLNKLLEEDIDRIKLAASRVINIAECYK